MKIPSLLNPKGPKGTDEYRTNSRTPASQRDDGDMDYQDSPRSQPATTKTSRTRRVRDELKWELGDPKGVVAYPVRTTTNAAYIKHFKRFDLFPPSVDTIKDYPQTIPYKSNVKDFNKKFGRDSFEVFHYCFTIPSTGEEHAVVWDYNIGLVRITAFFKSLNHAKTIPRKSIKTNEGLDDLCPSITGGKIPLQGYYMPYAAAKAMAATFCYEIRYALIPLFGEDFLTQCLPTDKRGYQSFVVEKRILEECAAQVREWRLTTQEQLDSSSLQSKAPTHLNFTSSPENPALRKKQLKAKAATKHKRYESEDEDVDIPGRWSDCEEDWTPSATSTAGINFTTVNKKALPRKPGRADASGSPESSYASSLTTGVDSHGKKRSHSDFMNDEQLSYGVNTSPGLLKRRIGDFTAEEHRAAEALLLLASGVRESHRTPLSSYIEDNDDNDDKAVEN